MEEEGEEVSSRFATFKEDNCWYDRIQGDRIHKQLFVTDISMQKSLHNTNQNDNGSSNNDAMIDHIGRMWFSENFGALNWHKIDSVLT